MSADSWRRPAESLYELLETHVMVKDRLLAELPGSASEEDVKAVEGAARNAAIVDIADAMEGVAKEIGRAIFKRAAEVYRTKGKWSFNGREISDQFKKWSERIDMDFGLDEENAS